MYEWIKQGFKDAITELVKSSYGAVGSFISGWLITSTHFLVLVGGPICILAYVFGWGKGMKATGILFLAHVLVSGLLS